MPGREDQSVRQMEKQCVQALHSTGGGGYREGVKFIGRGGRIQINSLRRGRERIVWDRQA